MSVEWKTSGTNAYDAFDRVSGEKIRSASRVDLVFGSNSQLRSIAEVYAWMIQTISLSKTLSQLGIKL